ncbi:MAG: TetR/AcrR family transcriptional regulator [Actinomycetota bacterium]
MASDAEQPLSRGHKKRAKTRRRLIDAAVDVIASVGEGFSLGDVSAAAGVSHGTFYNYFRDREELIAAIVPEVLGSFAAEGAEAVVDDDPAVRFAGVSALALRRAAVEPDAVRVVVRLAAAQQALLDGAPVRHLIEDLDAGFAAGRFISGADAATVDLVVGTLLAASRRIVDGGVDDDYPAQVLDRLLRALGVPAPEAADLTVEGLARADAALQPV